MIGVPLVGELEISLPPCVVPTEAEVALAKLGVRFTVAPYNGLVEDALIEEVVARTTFTVVLAVFVASSCDVAVMVTLPAVPGAVHVPVLALIVPALADHVMPLVAPPVAVILKVVELFTVRVGTAGVMAPTVTVCGATVTELSAKSPAALVARSQKVLVIVIAAVVMAVPLVGEAEMSFPPCAVPTDAVVALEKVGVRLTVAPYKGLVDEAASEAVTAGTTVTTVVAVFEGSSCEVAVMLTFPAVFGAVHAPVFALIVPALADHVMPFVTPPVAVVLKVVALLTVRVGAAGAIALTTTACGVTVTDVS